jgi:archaellum component FlaG (FlaF/FlaG flagellin family)
MGFGVSVATVILIVGLVGILAVTFPIAEKGLSDISGALDEKGSRQTEKQGIAFQIINISTYGTCASYNLSFVVNNTGSMPIKVGEIMAFDNNIVLNLSNSTTTLKIYSSRYADGEVNKKGGAYIVNDMMNVSGIGLNYTPDGAMEESRTYLSFDTSVIPDNAAVQTAGIYAYVFRYYANVSPTWYVNYSKANNVIGNNLTSGVWGPFSYVGRANYAGTTGWKLHNMSGSYINKQGDTDFELKPGWAITVLGRWDNISIIESENNYPSYMPFLLLTYQRLNASQDILLPTKDINMTYNRLSSTSKIHRLMLVTENGATVYGNYECR